MPTIAQIEYLAATDVSDRLYDAAREAWTSAFARMIPSPTYPGGPVKCSAHDVADWSADKIETAAIAQLLAVCKNLIDNGLAQLPTEAKGLLDNEAPGWSECADSVDAVRNVLESFPEN